MEIVKLQWSCISSKVLPSVDLLQESFLIIIFLAFSIDLIKSSTIPFPCYKLYRTEFLRLLSDHTLDCFFFSFTLLKIEFNLRALEFSFAACT